MHMGMPPPILFKIVGHMFGKKNVAGIAAIHHPLRDVDARAGDVACSFSIADPLTGPLWIPIRTGSSGCARSALLISIAQTTGASGAVRKTSAMPSPVGNSHQFACASACAELLGAADNRIQLLKRSRCSSISSLE